MALGKRRTFTKPGSYLLYAPLPHSNGGLSHRNCLRSFLCLLIFILEKKAQNVAALRAVVRGKSQTFAQHPAPLDRLPPEFSPQKPELRIQQPER